MTPARSPERLRGSRSLKHQKGSTAVEFSLVLLPMFWLIVGLIEAGLFLAAQYELQNAVLDASRKIRTGVISLTTSPAPTAASFKAEICAKVNMIKNCEASLRIEVKHVSDAVGKKFADLQPGTVNPDTRMTEPLSFGPSSPEVFNLGKANDPTAVIATYDWHFVLPMIGYLFSNVPEDNTKRRLHGVAVFKNENYT